MFGVRLTHEKDDGDDFGDLNEFESQRRELLDKVADPPLTILRNFAGTALKAMSESALFWANVTMYTLFRLLATQYPHPIKWPVMSLTFIGPLGGFMSFFVVFYVSQSYTRFQAQYNACMMCQSRIVDISILAKSCLPRPAALRLVRHVNAAHVLGYTALKNAAYTEANFLLPFNSRYLVLTEAELEELRATGLERGGGTYRMAVLWAIEGVLEISKIGPRYDNYTGMGTREILLFNNVLGLRDQMNLLYSFADQPIPFIYVHMVHFSTHVYLPLFTYGVFTFMQTLKAPSWGEEVISAVIVFLNCLFILGLVGVAAKLVDPFGTDVEDLSVMHYVRQTFEASRKILAADRHHARPLDEVAEVAMDESRLAMEEEPGGGGGGGGQGAALQEAAPAGRGGQKVWPTQAEELAQHGRGAEAGPPQRAAAPLAPAPAQLVGGGRPPAGKEGFQFSLDASPEKRRLGADGKADAAFALNGGPGKPSGELPTRTNRGGGVMRNGGGGAGGLPRVR